MKFIKYYYKFIILCCFVLNGCITPIVFKLNNESYKSEQPRITILPIYARTAQLYEIQKISPLLQDLELDEQYMNYNEYEHEFEGSAKIKQNIFYLVISTRY